MEGAAINDPTMIAAEALAGDVAGSLGVPFGITEWSLRPAYRSGDYAGICRNYKISGGLIGGVALLNIRVFF